MWLDDRLRGYGHKAQSTREHELSLEYMNNKNERPTWLWSAAAVLRDKDPGRRLRKDTDVSMAGL